MKKWTIRIVLSLILAMSIILCSGVSEVDASKTNKDVTKSFKDKEKLEDLLANFDQVIGKLQTYCYSDYLENGSKEKINSYISTYYDGTLTDRFKLVVASHNAKVNKNLVDMGFYGINKKKKNDVYKIAEGIFNKKPAKFDLPILNENTLDTSNFYLDCGKTSDNMVAVEWYEVEYKIDHEVKKIIKINSTHFTVTKHYNLYDRWDDTIPKFKLIATFKVKKDADSDYGYIVEGLTLK